MAVVGTNDSTLLQEATTLLEHIDQVIGWLPKREAPRQDLLRAVAQIGQRLASETLSNGEILNLQVHVLRLQGSPLRTLLNRRVAELGDLYGPFSSMKLVVQPDAGTAPIVTAVKQAKATIDVLVFRLDLQEITRCLEAAAARGVVVRALIAYTNRGGEKSLRELEMRLLEKGITVSRTADDLVRYHGKMKQLGIVKRAAFLLLSMFATSSFRVLRNGPNLTHVPGGALRLPASHTQGHVTMMMSRPAANHPSHRRTLMWTNAPAFAQAGGENDIRSPRIRSVVLSE